MDRFMSMNAKSQVVPVHMLCSHQAEKNGHLCHETSRKELQSCKIFSPPRPDSPKNENDNKIVIPKNSSIRLGQPLGPIFVETNGTSSNIDPFIVPGRDGTHHEAIEGSRSPATYFQLSALLLEISNVEASYTENLPESVLNPSHCSLLKEIDQFLANIPRIEIPPNHTKPTYSSKKAYIPSQSRTSTIDWCINRWLVY